MERVLSGKLLTVEGDGVQLPTERYNGANCAPTKDEPFLIRSQKK